MRRWKLLVDEKSYAFGISRDLAHRVMSRCVSIKRRTEQGFGYLLLLFALALFGVVLAGLGRTWTLASQRERETELLFIGAEFSEALASYRDRSPAGQPQAPQSLDDLVEDKRFPFEVRHLRRIYKDPMTHLPDWGTVIIDGRIAGVFSRSTAQPVREVLPEFVALKVVDGEKTTYAGWVFIPTPLKSVGAAPPPSPPPRTK